MNARELYFVKPYQVEIRDLSMSALQPNQVLIKNLYSGISAGTEMLVYRGQLPPDMALDEGLAAFSEQNICYPLKYGYACVGRIEDVAKNIDTKWLGKEVFSFQPHASHHICELGSVIPLPDGVDPKEAVFLANMETAVNLVQDANPRLGERTVVLGQGLVGLLVTKILAQFPLAGHYAVEADSRRQILAVKAGAQESFSSKSVDEIESLGKQLRLDEACGGADVVFELSGSPAALNLAIELCAYSGRIVVGSWYGTKSAEINLGERFHRNRIAIVSSQVSTIAPELNGRWDKARRFSVTWDMIKKCQPAQFISHCLPFDEAGQAYRLLDEGIQDTTQIVFDYQA